MTDLPPQHSWRREELRCWLAQAPPRPWRYELSSNDLVDANGKRLVRIDDADVAWLLVLVANNAAALLRELDQLESERNAYAERARAATGHQGDGKA